MSEPALTPASGGTASAVATAPLRSALKKKKATTAATGGASVASFTAGGSDPTASATGAAASLTGSTALGAATNAARIRAAAEEKATQLHASRAAQEQWDQWVTQVQLKLLDPASAAAPSTMSRAAMVLTPAQYGEVREERGAARRCAWPPCDATLDAADAKKKYRLSLKAQRVYDVEEGQHYCGPECFVQSQMYEKQLSDEPFYLRHTQKQQQQKNKSQAAAVPATAAIEPAAAVSSDPGVITQLLIVEKEAGVTQPPQPPVAASAGSAAQTAETAATVAADAAAAAKAAAFAVEGYHPRASQQQVALAAGSVSAASPAPTTTKARAASAAAAAPSAATAAGATGPSVRFADVNSGATPAASTDAAAASASVSSTGTAAAAAAPQREFLSFDPLPAVLQQSVTETAGSRELSRAEFEALSEEERMDWMAHIALRERAHIGTQRPVSVAAPPAATATPIASAAPAAADADAATGADAPASAEKKIKRRKTPAEKAAAAAAGTAASPGVSPVKPASSSSSSSSSSRRASCAPSTLGSHSLLADDLTAGPLITPEEIKANIAAVRSAPLPPFVQLLQCVMRWSNERTMQWMQHGQGRGATNATDAHPQAHARRGAFLTLVQQQWLGVAGAVGMRHRAPEMVRDLQELAHTFSFDQSLPPLSAQQWAALTLLLLRAVAQRKAREEKILPADTHAHSWQFMQPFSTLTATNAPTPSAAAAASSSVSCALCASSTSPSLLAAVAQLLHATGFSIAQMDSLYQTLADGGWMQPQ